jgi:hypothetical protein
MTEPDRAYRYPKGARPRHDQSAAPLQRFAGGSLRQATTVKSFAVSLRPGPRLAIAIAACEPAPSGSYHNPPPVLL